MTNQPHLISFSEAQVAGEAIVRRWMSQCDEPLPLMHGDAGWADMARTAWEAVHKHRAAQAGEAGTAETTKIGSVHEHAVPEGNAP